MLKEIVHIGLTVSDIDKSIEFYQNILGLTKTGELVMQGKETDKLFGKENVKVKIAYMNGEEKISAPPIELLQFVDNDIIKEEGSLFKTSASEICFKVENIERLYKKLKENSVECISEPQYFDFTEFGFRKSKALYFKDPDGIILEAMEYID